MLGPDTCLASLNGISNWLFPQTGPSLGRVKRTRTALEAPATRVPSDDPRVDMTHTSALGDTRLGEARQNLVYHEPFARKSD